MGYIYNFQPDPNSQNSLAAAEALGLKISSHEASPKLSQRLSQPAQELASSNYSKSCDSVMPYDFSKLFPQNFP